MGRLKESTNDISAAADQALQTEQQIQESFRTFGRKLEEKDGKILGVVESLKRIADSSLNKITSMEREIESLRARAEQVNGW